MAKSENSADRFAQKRKHNHLLLQFEDTIKLVIHCYYIILKSEKFDLKQIPKKYKDKPENFLRTNLVRYLRYNRKLYPLTKSLSFYWEFATEEHEKDVKGRSDIAVAGIVSDSFDEEVLPEQQYFGFECKRLKGLAGNDSYIRKGIQRFANEQYSKYMCVGGMIGFVEKSSVKIDAIKDDINTRLHRDFSESMASPLTSKQYKKGFKYSYTSTHSRKKKGIDLVHLLFDYSTVIISE